MSNFLRTSGSSFPIPFFALAASLSISKVSSGDLALGPVFFGFSSSSKI
jgi:hypothetical protein